MSHPNLCGFGKALLEACLEGSVRELVLVNCCDTIRSVYDVLLEHGNLDFLYLMDALHTGGTCARTRMKEELLRLARAYGAYRGTEFDPEKFRAAFCPPDRPAGPYLSVLGARVGDALFEQMERTMPLPCATTPASTTAAWPRRRRDWTSMPAWSGTPARCWSSCPVCG